jgi:hypothetical protein
VRLCATLQITTSSPRPTACVFPCGASRQAGQGCWRERGISLST